MSQINMLINQPLLKMGRASDLCWILFGKRILDKDKKGNTIEKGEYSLHLQCPWRLRSKADSQIKLASGDIYEPNSKTTWSPDFNWDILGNNLFDEKVQHFFAGNKIISVKSVLITQTNDLQIEFSNEFILECFVNMSPNTECWRFFRYNSDAHMVAYSNCAEFQ